MEGIKIKIDNSGRLEELINDILEIPVVFEPSQSLISNNKPFFRFKTSFFHYLISKGRDFAIISDVNNSLFYHVNLCNPEKPLISEFNKKEKILYSNNKNFAEEELVRIKNWLSFMKNLSNPQYI